MTVRGKGVGDFAIAKGDMAAAFRARQGFYDLLAAVYFRPLSADQVEAFAAYDWESCGTLNEEMAEGVNHLSRYLARRNSGTRQEIAVDYTAVFGGLSSFEGLYAVPVESVFTSDDGLMYQRSYHQVHEIFAREGIVRAEGVDYPDDHLSFMMEYLAQQSGRTADCIGSGDVVEALRLTVHCRAFLEEHIASWFPRLRERALLLLATRFYRGILALTQGYLDFDDAFLRDAEAELLTLVPSCNEKMAV